MVGAASCMAVLLAVPHGPSAGAATAPPGPVSLVLVDELTWADAPPELEGFAKANLSMRSASDRSGAADTYLTLGKGGRSAGLGAAGVGRVEPLDGGLRLVDWPELVRRDRSLHYGGALGSLGHAVEGAGGRLTLVAPSSGLAAAAAAADGDGEVRSFLPWSADAVGSARRSGDHLVVAVDGPDLGSALGALDGSCTLVASASTPDGNRHLGVLAASPECGLGRDGLVSESTHRDGLATLPDVTRTFLGLAGAGATVPLTATAAVGRQALVDADARTRAADLARTPLVWLFVLLHLAGAVVAVRRPAARPAVACALLAVPSAAFLVMVVPWWRWGPWVAVAAGGAMSAALAVGGSVLCRRDVRAGVGVLAALGAAVVAVDALFGGPLEIDAPFGNSTVGAGRFFGVGNIGSGVLVAGLVVAGGLALDAWGRRALPGVVVALGAGVAVLGAPWFGADAGGIVYGGLAGGVLVVGFVRGRVGARWLAALAVAAVLTAVVFALADLVGGSGPATHLGRAVAGDSVVDLAVRKGSRALGSVTNPMALIVVIGAVALAVVRRHRMWPSPALRATGWALLTAAVAGSVLNDSGVIVGAAVVAVAWPTLVAVGVARPTVAPVGATAAAGPRP